MIKISDITQTEDPTLNPYSSNSDSNLHKNDLGSLDLKSNNSSLTHTDDTSQDANKGDELELITRTRNFASSFIKSKQGFYIIDNNTKELVKKINKESEVGFLNKRKHFSALNKTFASLNVYEKEVIVWVRLNCNKYKEKDTLIMEVIQLFNISESRAKYLVDSSGIPNT